MHECVERMESALATSHVDRLRDGGMGKSGGFLPRRYRVVLDLGVLGSKGQAMRALGVVIIRNWGAVVVISVIPSAYSPSLLADQQFGYKIADAEVLIAVKNIMLATELANWVGRIS